MAYLVQLVREVGKWPCLNDSEFNSDRDIREKREAWRNICKNIFPNWDTWPIEEKNSKGREAQGVWNSFQNANKRLNYGNNKIVNVQDIKTEKNLSEITNDNVDTINENENDNDSEILKVNNLLQFNKLAESDESDKKFFSSFLYLYEKFGGTLKLSLQTSVIEIMEKYLLLSETENSTTNEPHSIHTPIDLNLSSPKKVFISDAKDDICVICDSDENLQNIKVNDETKSINSILVDCFNIKFESANRDYNNYHACKQCAENIIAALKLKKRIEKKDKRLANVKHKKITKKNDFENNDVKKAKRFDNNINLCRRVNDSGNIKSIENFSGKCSVNNTKKILHSSMTDLTCPICKENFDTDEMLTKHNYIHLEELQCNECRLQFHSLKSFSYHNTLIHKAKKFACRLCDKQFVSHDSVKQHIQRVHKKIKAYICTVCPERFVNYLDKKKHLNDVHGIASRVYKCRECEKIYNTSSRLSAHVKSFHYQIKNYKCEECCKPFESSTDLKNHMLSHTGIKNFKCDYCGKSYGRRHTILQHLKIHADLRNYVCEKCGKAFVQKCSLKGHMKTHEKFGDNC